MPLYEYECDACGGRFEVIQKFSETTSECRRCGKGPVRRLMAAPAQTAWMVEWAAISTGSIMPAT